MICKTLKRSSSHLLELTKLKLLVVLDIVHKTLIAHVGDQAMNPLLAELLAGVPGRYFVKDGSFPLSTGKSSNPTPIMHRSF